MLDPMDLLKMLSSMSQPSEDKYNFKTVGELTVLEQQEMKSIEVTGNQFNVEMQKLLARKEEVELRNKLWWAQVRRNHSLTTEEMIHLEGNLIQIGTRKEIETDF